MRTSKNKAHHWYHLNRAVSHMLRCVDVLLLSGELPRAARLNPSGRQAAREKVRPKKGDYTGHTALHAS